MSKLFKERHLFIELDPRLSILMIGNTYDYEYFIKIDDNLKEKITSISKVVIIMSSSYEKRKIDLEEFFKLVPNIENLPVEYVLRFLYNSNSTPPTLLIEDKN